MPFGKAYMCIYVYIYTHVCIHIFVLQHVFAKISHSAFPTQAWACCEVELLLCFWLKEVAMHVKEVAIPSILDKRTWKVMTHNPKPKG